jgi:hypothetical protein
VPPEAGPGQRQAYARDLGRELAELAQTALAAERPVRPETLVCRSVEVTP